jgi:glycosyltransferase involved in cell wall biosynthesis
MAETRLSVLQLGPLPPPWGGVQTNIDGLRQYLRRHGHEVAGVNLTRHRRADTAEEYFPAGAWELLALLGRLPHKILHLHLGGTLNRRLLGLCLALTSLPGKKSVLSFHSGGYPSTPEGRKAHWASAAGYCFRRFDAVIGVNDELRETFARFGVRPERNHRILPYWVPEEAPALEAGAARDFIESHKPCLISVGLLEDEYDLPRQLEAFERLRETHPGAGLLWIGSGSREADLRRRIAASPAGSHVLLLGDVPRPQTLAAIAAASLMWRTTLYDGDAVSVREALHFGTPVVATDNRMRPQGSRLCAIAHTESLLEATRAALAESGAGQARQRRAQDGEANLRAVLEVYRSL